MTHKSLMKDIVLPTEITYDKSTYKNTYGKFSIYPFEKGVGVTVANSLRRVLLSSIPGYAITSIKIEGVNHEFEPKGVKEDLTDIILMIKKIKVKLLDGSDKKIVRIEKKGSGELLAGDFEIDDTVEIENKDLKIATLNSDADLVIDIQIEYGRGYRSAEDLLDSNSIISVIPVDAIFSPIMRVNFLIEDYRVGERTDNEKVIIEVWTDGTVLPEDAVMRAAAIIMKYFSVLVKKEYFDAEEELSEEVEEKEMVNQNDIKLRSIDILELSVRSYNCLKGVGVNTIGELLKYDKESLMKIKNFGKKSLTEIAQKLELYGLALKESENDIDVYDDEDIEEIEEGE